MDSSYYDRLKFVSHYLCEQELWDSFTSTQEGLARKHIPTKILNGKQTPPWMNSEILKLI